jgi:integrase
VYRSYYGPIPTDSSGQPLLKSQWPQKRDHSWVVRWFGLEGNRYSKSFDSRKEAEWFAETKQAEVREEKADPPDDISLDEFIVEHKRVMRGQVSPCYLYDQLRALQAFKKHLPPNIQLRDIKPRHAESFVAARLDSGVKVASVNKDIRTLKRVFGLAIEPRGYLLPHQNAFARIKQRKQCPKQIRYVSAAEFRKILAAAPSAWWRAFFLVAYTTAARLSEILNLTWLDVDFEDNRIRIARKEATESVTHWEPKDHEGRLLPAPPETMQALADLQQSCAEGCAYVFLSVERAQHLWNVAKSGKWSGRQLVVNNLHRELKAIRSEAKVAKFTFHDLRRSCLTNMARSLPIHVVQKIAGHSDIKTTQQYYLAVEEDDLEKARKVQSELLATPPTDQLLTNSAENNPFRAGREKKASRVFN